MKRYFGFWILFLLLIVVIIAFSTGLVELPKQNERNLFQGARISAVTPIGRTHKENQDRLKVIIAVDTSCSMAESFPMGDDNTNLVNTTAFLINLLSSRPNTEVGILLMSNAYNQESGTGPSDYKRDGVNIKQEAFIGGLSNDDIRLSFLRPINLYTPVSDELHSDINNGMKRIEDMVIHDDDDEGARYAVLIITDAKTDEKLEDAEKALEELYNHGAEVYFLLPQNNGDDSEISKAIEDFPHINQLDISTTTTDNFTNEALMGAYLDFFSKINTRGNISMSHQRIIDEKVNSPKDGVFRYRFSVEGYHYGISALAPEGFYIKQISVDDPGIQISAGGLVIDRDYPYEREDEIQKDAKAQSDMVFCSRDLEIDVSDVYTYYVDICADSNTSGVVQDEDYQKIAAPKFERIDMSLEDFCVTVSPDKCVKNKELREGTDVYTINHSKAFNIEMELMLKDEGEENTTSINDYVVWLDSTQMNPKIDKRIWYNTEKNAISLNFEGTDFTREEELVFVIADENGNEIKKFIIDINDEAPKINDEYMAMTAVQKKGIFFGSKSKDLRVDVKLNKNGEAEIPLDGWVVDPEGQRVKYYLQRDVVSVGSYQFAVRKDDGAYYLDIEKKRCLMKRDNPIRITLFFMDENNVKNQQELEIVIEE